MTKGLKEHLYEVIFEADTPLGKKFDFFLIALIILSILSVILETVPQINQNYTQSLKVIEWIITGVFTLEYFVRIWIVRHPFRFVFSFYGIIDFLSFIPTYLAFFFSGTQGLMVIRAIRLMRIFRILKLNRYVNESNFLLAALKASRYKISVFLYAVLMLIIIVGALMYLVEGEENGFTSIPQSMYWVIVTITTVGFGDVTPGTTLGKFIASFIMILGYAIIAVPTGIVTAEVSRLKKRKDQITTQVCPECLKEDHDENAVFCKHCGACLNDEEEE